MTVSLLGAGGHARSVISLLDTCGYEIQALYDESFQEGETIFSHPILGDFSSIPADITLVIGAGDITKRRELFERFKHQILEQNLIHPSAIMAKYTQIGLSNQILAASLVNAGCVIGDNNLINSHAVLEHEVSIGNHNHISVGSILCGRVTIGNNCFLGAGSVVIDKVMITDNVIIGANSVVIDSITNPGTYVGNPVRKIK